MNAKDADAMADVIVAAIKRAIDGPKVHGRIQELENKIAALEAKPHLKYCGVYESGRTYQPGDAVTRSGSLWVCNVETTGEPGRDFVGWQLGVKRGRV